MKGTVIHNNKALITKKLTLNSEDHNLKEDFKNLIQDKTLEII